jgi:hypothetical protein
VEIQAMRLRWQSLELGVAGGFSLLLLAGIAVCLAMGVLELCEWARIVSIVSIAVGLGCTVLSLFALEGHLMIPVVPSIVCHFLLMAPAVWMLACLLLPRIKQAFGMVADYSSE